MKFSKATKRVLSLSMATAVAAATIVAPSTAKKADAATSYKGYLCFSTAKWTFRNNHDDSKFSNTLQNSTNPKVITSAAKKAKFKDVTMKKNKKAKTYTVRLTKLSKKVIGNDKTFNALYVDTNIPGSLTKKVTVTNVKLIIDGKTVKTIKKGILTPDPGKESDDENVQIQVINQWNSRVGKVSYKMPKKSLAIQYTIKMK